jgi:hypothetical protein
MQMHTEGKEERCGGDEIRELLANDLVKLVHIRLGVRALVALRNYGPLPFHKYVALRVFITKYCLGTRMVSAHC